MSLSLGRSLPIRFSSRPFSTTAARPIKLELKESFDPESSVEDVVPAYPYGPKRWYKTADKGLYGGKTLRFGNNVGKKIETKTRRRFALNVTRKHLYSDALQRMVQLNVTTRVLRTIDKVGGLDEYLLGEKEARIKALGLSGWWLRWAIMNTPSIQRRYAQQRAELGIPQPETEQIQLLTPLGDDIFENEVEGAEEAVGQTGVVTAEGEEIEAQELFTDDSFRLESVRGHPPLRFRVGDDHIIDLDSMGWRRAREIREKREQATKALEFRRKAVDHVDEYMRLYEARLEATGYTDHNGREIDKDKALRKARLHFFRSADRWLEDSVRLQQQARESRRELLPSLEEERGDDAVSGRFDPTSYVTEVQDDWEVPETAEVPETGEPTVYRHAESSRP